MVKAWWTIFLTCGAIAGITAISPVVLALVLLFVTYVLAPICIIWAAIALMRGN